MKYVLRCVEDNGMGKEEMYISKASVIGSNGHRFVVLTNLEESALVFNNEAEANIVLECLMSAGSPEGSFEIEVL